MYSAKHMEKKESKEETRRARKQDTKHKVQLQAVAPGALEPHGVKTGHRVQKLAKFII